MKMIVNSKQKTDKKYKKHRMTKTNFPKELIQCVDFINPY